MVMTTLQNPVKARLEAINDDLKDVTKAQRSFGKALDRVSHLDKISILYRDFDEV